MAQSDIFPCFFTIQTQCLNNLRDKMMSTDLR